MRVTITINDKKYTDEIAADMLLIDYVRNHGCYSVKEAVKQVTADFVLY